MAMDPPIYILHVQKHVELNGRAGGGVVHQLQADSGQGLAGGRNSVARIDRCEIWRRMGMGRIPTSERWRLSWENLGRTFWKRYTEIHGMSGGQFHGFSAGDQ